MTHQEVGLEPKGVEGEIAMHRSSELNFGALTIRIVRWKVILGRDVVMLGLFSCVLSDFGSDCSPVRTHLSWPFGPIKKSMPLGVQVAAARHLPTIHFVWLQADKSISAHIIDCYHDILLTRPLAKRLL